MHKAITVFIGLVWLVNGLVCKVLHLVPRHQQIVAKILGNEYASQIVFVIGILEIFMAIWVFSKYQSKWNAIVQMILVAVMNVLEFFFARDLLLWGNMNSFFAVLFIGLIYYNEFVIHQKKPTILR